MNVLLVYIFVCGEIVGFVGRGKKTRRNEMYVLPAALLGVDWPSLDMQRRWRGPTTASATTGRYKAFFLSTLLLFFRIPVGDSFLSSPLDTHSSVVDWSRTNKKKRKSWSIKIYMPHLEHPFQGCLVPSWTENIRYGEGRRKSQQQQQQQPSCRTMALAGNLKYDDM